MLFRSVSLKVEQHRFHVGINAESDSACFSNEEPVYRILAAKEDARRQAQPCIRMDPVNRPLFD